MKLLCNIITIFLVIMHIACNYGESNNDNIILNNNFSGNRIRDLNLDKYGNWKPSDNNVLKPISFNEISLGKEYNFELSKFIINAGCYNYIYDEKTNKLYKYDINNTNVVTEELSFEENEVVLNVVEFCKDGIIVAGRNKIYLYINNNYKSWANIYDIIKLSANCNKIYFVKSTGIKEFDNLIGVCDLDGNYVNSIGKDVYNYEDRTFYISFLSLSIINDNIYLTNKISNKVMLINSESGISKINNINVSELEFSDDLNNKNVKYFKTSGNVKFRTIVNLAYSKNNFMFFLYRGEKRNYLVKLNNDVDIMNVYNLCDIEKYIIDYCISLSNGNWYLDLIIKDRKNNNKVSVWRAFLEQSEKGGDY